MRVAAGFGTLIFFGCVLLPACSSDDLAESPAPEADPPPLGATTEYLGPAQKAALKLWMARRAAAAENRMCWRPSYGRGAGDALSECPGSEKSGALCYPACKSGFDGVGPVCWERCRSGYTDDGAFCRKDPRVYAKDSYGRGAGYATWDEAVCRKESSTGCEYSGGMWYPRCKSGYEAAGCCICQERRCESGYVDDGAFCRKPGNIYAKSSYGRGVGKPMTCPAGKEQSGALCYDACRANFTGVGPVCWHKCPSTQPFDCGAACAQSEGWCAVGITNMIVAPLELASNIVEAVLSGGALNALKSTLKAALVNAGKLAAREILRKSKTFSQLATKLSGFVVKDFVAKFGVDVVTEVAQDAAENILVYLLSDEDPDVLDILSEVDPTGVAAVVEAFNHPICLTDEMPDLSLFADAKLPSNLAKKRPATQSSVASGSRAANAVDTALDSLTARTSSEADPWWRVDLGAEEWVGRIAIHRIAEAGVYPALRVILTDSAGHFVTATTVSGGPDPRIEARFSAPARYVTVQRVGTGVLALSEVEVHENELRDTFRESGWVDLVRGSPTTQSSTAAGAGPELAADGDPATASVTSSQDKAWWQVDLGRLERTSNVVVDGDLADFDVVLLGEKAREVARASITGAISGPTEVRFEERGRYLRIERRGQGSIKLRSVVANALRSNFALSKDAVQSSDLALGTGAHRAVDGNPATASTTGLQDLFSPRWEVDLGRTREVSRVRLLGAVGLANYEVAVLDEQTVCMMIETTRVCYPKKSVVETVQVKATAKPTELVRVIAKGRYVRIARQGGQLVLGEVQVF